jgi:hypothetical protein
MTDSIAALERAVDSLGWWLEFWTAIVVLGLLLETATPAWKALTNRQWVLLRRHVGAIMVALGVAGELFVQFRLSPVETALRTESDQLVAEARQRATEANEKAESERLARVKIEQQLAFRSLTPEQREAIKRVLNVDQPAEVVVAFVATLDGELYARQFAATIEKGGWKATLLRLLDLNPIGIGIIVQDVHSPPHAGDVLAEALKAAEIKFGVDSEPRLAEGAVQLMVGHKDPGGILE